MNKPTMAAAAFVLIASGMTLAHAEVPGWVKQTAGFWSEGAISDNEFIAAISFLIENGVITVPPTDASEESGDQAVPSWVKETAGFWSEGLISDDEFLGGIQYLIGIGVISVSDGSAAGEAGQADPELAALEKELAACSEIKTAYKRIDCEKPIQAMITMHQYKAEAEMFDLGTVAYYWKGLGSEGNSFETSPSGQPLLFIRMLAVNTSSEIASLNCTSPSICNYDMWDGTKSFKYSAMDFTSGQIVLNPGDAKEFNIMFGPNIGYGGTEFEYDPSKSYQFRISEPFGSIAIDIPLG